MRIERNNMANIAKIKAIEAKNKKRILQICPGMPERSGIYIFTRVDELDIRYCYVGQAVNLLRRCASHLNGYQYIDLSLKKHGLFSKDNPYGYKLIFHEYVESLLDEKEQEIIKNYASAGYQLRNKTGGSQGVGKVKIAEYKPSKGYRDGLEQGKKNCSKEISNLFDKHLNVSTKRDPPTANQKKALEKFNNFLEYYKGNKDELQD